MASPATASAKNRGQTERFPVFTPLFAFDEFAKQLAHLDLGCFQRLPSERRRAVDLAQRFAVALLGWNADSPSSPVREAADTGCPGLIRYPCRASSSIMPSPKMGSSAA